MLADVYIRFGRVAKIVGLKVYIEGLNHIAVLGASVKFLLDKEIEGEIIGIEQNFIIAMPYSDIIGIKEGSQVQYLGLSLSVFPHESWAGRILNSKAMPIDGKGPLVSGNVACYLKNAPTVSYERRLVEKIAETKIRSIDVFLSCCYGQRMGIFAGSGVGKTVLISQLIRFAKFDYIVLGLVGERGREVGEFLNNVLTEEMRKKTIIVVETSDSAALLRKKAAYLTMTIAEYLKDKGYEVLCLIDSITRFAFAQREIGLAAGEPPTTKGYPPTIFFELAQLLERAGPGKLGQGNITGMFTVLVEGDDLQDPVADNVRAILDGHIVLDRKIAEKGIFPAINILKSISRTVPACQTERHFNIMQKAKKLLSAYEEMEDMIMLGAYRKGTNKLTDTAIAAHDNLINFAQQGVNEATDLVDTLDWLEKII